MTAENGKTSFFQEMFKDLEKNKKTGVKKTRDS